MKRAFPLIAFAAVAAIAAEPKYGILVEGLLSRPDAPSPYDPTIGFGGMAAIEARFDVDDKIAIAPFVGFEYVASGMDAEEDGVKAEVSMTSMFIPLGVGLQFALTPNFRLALTPEFDISLGGTGKVEASYNGQSYSEDGDIEDEDNPFLLGLGIVYGMNENTSIIAGYKPCMNDYLEDYKLNKFYLGGRFAL